jgi:hypothetical protein
VQHLMLDALLGQGPSSEADLLGQLITPSAGMSSAQRLAIYQRGYYARLLQCMQGQFKALNHALGTELFSDFAREYLREMPSRSPTLAMLGQAFPDFLQRHRPDAATDEKESWIDFMVDLADFEWRLYSLFDAPGAEQGGYAGLDQLDDPALLLQPCVILCRYRFPVGEYYQQVAREENPEFPEARDACLALVRTNYKIGIFTLLPAQYHFLQQLRHPGPATGIADALANTAHAFQRNIESVKQVWSAWQRGWLQAGFFQR